MVPLTRPAAERLLKSFNHNIPGRIMISIQIPTAIASKTFTAAEILVYLATPPTSLGCVTLIDAFESATELTAFKLQALAERKVRLRLE